MATPHDPFAPEPIEEVPLDNPPIAVALCQVRFPTVLEFANEQSLVEVQRQLKDEYPILDREQTVGFLIQPAQGLVPQQQQETIWRFRSKDRSWQVSLTTNFVTLDTKAYTSRANFMERLSRVLEVVANVGEPPECSRVGVRYVNRLVGARFVDQLSKWVRPEVVGSHAFTPSPYAELTHTISESRFQLSEKCGAQVRWGRLPANSTVDPSFEPLSETSWILDFDMFSTDIEDFAPEALVVRAHDFSEYAYRFFRWTVKPDLLKEFGGQVSAS